MNITIFGSCRQQMIEKYYNVTSIQQELTYPHYTKEIIQAIEYCKNRSTINKIDTKYCFRTGILENKEIDNKKLLSEFQKTDLFVVEIASRISYEWKGLYIHHILTEEPYGFNDRDNIIQRELSDEEIDNDIYKIKELLYPKKLLIVSHIYTREYGKRYELIKLLEKICIKYDIPFLSPSEYLNQEIQEVYQNEPILAHFTDYGKELMSYIYKRIITDIFKNKTLVYVIKQEYITHKRTNTDNFWGLGDIIRIMYFMYKKSFVSNYKLIIDISHHPISHYLEYIPHKYTNEVNNQLNTIQLITDNIDSTIENDFKNKDIIYIAVHCGLNAYDKTDYDIDIKLFVKRYLRPIFEMKQYINQKINELQLSDINIIHYRLGDQELVQKNVDDIKMTMISKCYNHLLNNLLPNSLLLTDSNIFKNYIRENNMNNIILFNHTIGHIGFHNKLDEIKNSLVEFFIATKSKSIQTYSIYPWISGYMYSIHKVYDIPIIDNITNLNHILQDYPIQPQILNHTNKLIFITGCNSLYFPSWLNLYKSIINNIKDSIIYFFDLGIEEKDKKIIDTLTVQYIYFDFNNYADWIHIKNNAGQWAWKAQCIKIILDKYPINNLINQYIIWCDSRNLIINNLSNLIKFVEKNGIHTTTTLGTIQKWTHNDTIIYLNASNYNDLRMRNAASITFNINLEWVRNFINEWSELSLIKECIYPENSDRKNHRQDQSILSILFYKYKYIHNYNDDDDDRGILIHTGNTISKPYQD